MGLPEVSPIFIRALAFASHKHRYQRRKDAAALPYINHPIALVSILASEAGVNDVEVLCAALLHDTVEDADTTIEELITTFGNGIASIVVEVTDDKKLLKQDRKQLQVVNAPNLSPKAQLVKVADKIANLRDVAHSPPTDWSRQRRLEYFDWAKEVVDAMPEIPPALLSLFNDSYERRSVVLEPTGFTSANRQEGMPA